MGRKPRVHFPGALYHVIARGNQRQAIFRSDADRRRYLDLLKQFRTRYDFHLYAYVLMSNHWLCGAQHKKCYVKLRIM